MKNQISIEGNCAFIHMVGGYVAVTDVADVPLIEQYRWYPLQSRRADGSTRAVYAQTIIRRDDGSRTGLYMHRLIAGASADVTVDHRDGDGLNNCRSNVRLATTTQNNRNQRLRSDNSSGFKGVIWDRDERKWQARIKVNGKTLHLGRHATVIEAAEAYDTAAIELHGQFARINFPVRDAV